MTMPATPLATEDQPPPLSNDSLNRLGALSEQIGTNVVDVAGFLDETDAKASAQLPVLGRVTAQTEQMIAMKDDLLTAIGSVTATTEAASDTVTNSIGALQKSAATSQSVAQWVQQVGRSMSGVQDTLSTVAEANTQIADIARQVNMLAINAKIEAARAGEAGRGFSVVADAVNELSQRTAQVAGGITESIQSLTDQVDTLRDEASGVGQDAQTVLDTSDEADTALTGIANRMRDTADQSAAAANSAERVGQAIAGLQPAIHGVASVLRDLATGVHQARDRVNGMIDVSEGLVQSAVLLGGASADQVFIDLVRELAEQASIAFEAALADGALALDAFFDRSYTPIPGTNPEQLMAPFTALCDRVLPPIQEGALTVSERVVFCAAVDENGYLPTHNKKFSAPQGADPVWNAANSRNRRLFNDRVGLKAGRNTEPFLLQTYRRDMGGGTFVLMKDVSSPITVQGRHWGGLRLAFKPS